MSGAKTDRAPVFSAKIARTPVPVPYLKHPFLQGLIRTIFLPSTRLFGDDLYQKTSEVGWSIRAPEKNPDYEMVP